MNEETTVLLAQQGQKQAFHRLYELHRDRIYRLAFRTIGTPQDAEDIMQETFIKAFRKIRTFRFDRSTSFSAWLSSICVNRIIDVLRQRKRRGAGRHLPLTALNAEAVSPHPSPERSAILKQAVQRIREEARDLTPRQRIMFDLRFDRHMDIRDIAEHLGCSESNVKTQLLRSLRKLRRTLEPLWEES